MSIIGSSVAEDVNTARQALADGVAVNGRFANAERDTPLTWAAGFGRANTAKLFLERGARPNTRNGEGHTALWEAAAAGLVDNNYGVTRLTPAVHRARARQAGAYAAIIRALAAHGGDPNLPDPNGVTPLGVAAYSGRYESVQALLEVGADPNRRDRFGRTPLEWAAYIGFPRIVRLLRAHGACINARRGLPDKHQRIKDELLYGAIANGDLRATRRLIARGADPDAHVSSSNHYSPYPYAPQPSDLAGFTPPLLAGEERRSDLNRDAIALYLLAHGANPNVCNEKGETPLMQAYGPQVCRALLQRGARVNARDHEGHTPLMTASAANAVLLLACGASVNARDRDGQTPLMAAASQNDVATMQLLLDHGARVHSRDHEGVTAVMRCGEERALKVLLAHGANINDQDARGQTALMIVANLTHGEGDAAACDADWGRVLLRHGANPNAQDRNGNTALMLLSAQGEYGYYESGDQQGFARALLAYGARRSLRNRYGRTTLGVARRYKAVSIVRLLRGKGQRGGSHPARQ